jgi:two-component system, OmpR family, alkaline phosphatase synthesis response regulator PhoP
MNERILLVEDEQALSVPLSDRLRREGYWVQIAEDGETGLTQAMEGPFDLILLDVMLPRKSGLDVCRDLRQRGVTTPILMLTARTGTDDKVLGLRIGADDYLAKPFDQAELLARVEALLRRALTTHVNPETVRQIGPIRVDLRRAEVHRDGRQIPLSAREFQLLRYFIEHSGALVTREELLREVWDYKATTSTRTVDVHVGWLRQKLEDDPKQPKLILTSIGLGYRFTG